MSGTAIPAIPAPVTADPGFWRQGIEGLNALRDQQAKQASADAYRQSLNPDGTVNTPKYNALIASGPGAWNAGLLMRQQGEAAGAQTSAATGQFNLASAQNSATNAAATAALAAPDDQLHATVAQQVQRLIDANMIPRDKGMTWLANLSNDPKVMRQQLETIRVQTLPPQQQQNWIYGTRPTITTPQGTYMPEVPEPGRGPPVTVVTPHGPPPGTTTVTSEPYDSQGIIPRDANGVPTRKPDGYTDVTKPVTAVPGVSPGGPPQIVPAPGSAPAASPLGSLPPGAPQPPPGQRLVGGRFVTPSAAPAAATPPPAAQPPATVPPPAVSTSTTLRGPGSAAAPPGAMPPAIKTPPQGQPDLLAKDNEVRTQANLAMPDQQKRLIAGQSALDALKLADTGPATGFVARVNAFFKAQGITPVPQGQLSDTDYRQLLQKNLLRFAQSSGRTAGTDLGLETQIHSNANVDDMLAGANRHVLIQDLGILKRDITQTQEMPASGPAGSVVKHVGEFSTKTAPEAFMWDTYTPPERAEIEAKYAKDGKTQQLHDSLELAVRRGAIPDPRKAAPAARPAVVAPPQPATNPLVPTN